MATAGRQRQVEGVDFVVDVAGERKAVLIDLRRHHELWEDFYDTLLVNERAAEPRESLEEVKKSPPFSRAPFPARDIPSI